MVGSSAIPIGVSLSSADVFFERHLFDTEWCGGAPAEGSYAEDPFTVKWGPAEIKENNITVVPLQVILDGKTYRDNIDMTRQEFSEHLATEDGRSEFSSPTAPDSRSGPNAILFFLTTFSNDLNVVEISFRNSCACQLARLSNSTKIRRVLFLPK